MTQTTMEFVLNAMYAAVVSALNDHQRAFANDTLFKCADLSCAPPLAPEILRRIARNADNQPAPARPRLVINNDAA
jgi:hypothetical protein